MGTLSTSVTLLLLRGVTSINLCDFVNLSDLVEFCIPPISIPCPPYNSTHPTVIQIRIQIVRAATLPPRDLKPEICSGLRTQIQVVAHSILFSIYRRKLILLRVPSNCVPAKGRPALGYFHILSLDRLPQPEVQHGPFAQLTYGAASPTSPLLNSTRQSVCGRWRHDNAGSGDGGKGFLFLRLSSRR